MAGRKKGKQKFKFEPAVEELEGIVSRLDSGDLGLDEMLKEFERGIHLVRGCKQFLDEAQKKVELLLADQDKLEFEELEAGEAEAAEEKGD